MKVLDVIKQLTTSFFSATTERYVDTETCHLKIITLIDCEIDFMLLRHIEVLYYPLSCQLLMFYEAKQISHRH